MISPRSEKTIWPLLTRGLGQTFNGVNIWGKRITFTIKWHLSTILLKSGRGKFILAAKDR